MWPPILRPSYPCPWGSLVNIGPWGQRKQRLWTWARSPVRMRSYGNTRTNCGETDQLYLGWFKSYIVWKRQGRSIQNGQRSLAEGWECENNSLALGSSWGLSGATWAGSFQEQGTWTWNQAGLGDFPTQNRERETLHTAPNQEAIQSMEDFNFN